MYISTELEFNSNAPLDIKMYEKVIELELIRNGYL